MIKKALTTVLAIGMCFVFGNAVSASTLGVAVDKGMTGYLEFYSEKNAGYGPKLGLDWGINDRFMLQLGCQFEGDHAKDNFNQTTFSLGARFEISENLAASLNYDYNDDESIMSLGLLSKCHLSDPLALAVKAEYLATSSAGDPGVNNSDSNTLSAFAGLEWQPSESIALNIGYEWNKTNYNDNSLNEIAESSDSLWTVGAEFAVGKICIYFDYDMPGSEDAPDTLTLGVAYNF